MAKAKKAAKHKTSKKKLVRKAPARKRKTAAKASKAAKKPAVRKSIGKKKPAKKPAVRKAAKKKTAKPAVRNRKAPKPATATFAPAMPKPVAVPGAWPFPMASRP